jgi:hypothetical protein
MPAEDALQHDEVERDRDEIEMLSALSTEMVALHKTQLGRGPTRPRRTATHDASARSATPSSLTDFAPWTRWLVVVMAGTMLLFGIDIVLHPFPAAVSDPFQKFVSCAIFFGAAALCVMKGLASKHERSAWWLFALAMALWGAGAVYFAVVLWNTEEPPVPSIADGFWLVFYLPAYAALYKLLRKRSGSARRGVWLDALVGGLGVGAAGAALVFQVVLANTEGTVAVRRTFVSLGPTCVLCSATILFERALSSSVSSRSRSTSYFGASSVGIATSSSHL